MRIDHDRRVETSETDQLTESIVEGEDEERRLLLAGLRRDFHRDGEGLHGLRGGEVAGLAPLPLDRGIREVEVGDEDQVEDSEGRDAGGPRRDVEGEVRRGAELLLEDRLALGVLPDAHLEHFGFWFLRGDGQRHGHGRTPLRARRGRGWERRNSSTIRKARATRALL